MNKEDNGFDWYYSKLVVVEADLLVIRVALKYMYQCLLKGGRKYKCDDTFILDYISWSRS